MLIAVCLAIFVGITLLSLVLGGTFVSITQNFSVDNSALLNGTVSTFEVVGESIGFEIDPLIAGIAILIAVSAGTAIIGVQVLGSGFNSASVKIITLISAYVGLWTLLSVLASGLIKSIEVFGSMIYITLTLGYTIGVIQKLSGGGDS